MERLQQGITRILGILGHSTYRVRFRELRLLSHMKKWLRGNLSSAFSYMKKNYRDDGAQPSSTVA